MAHVLHGYRNRNERFKEKSESHTRKAINRVNSTDSYTWNIIQNMASTAA